MKITFWGTRGSLPAAGPETQFYGGNTSCLSVVAEETMLILDAGSGIRRLGQDPEIRTYSRLDILLTHLHMDHIQGLGFFAPLFQPQMEIHIWGPASPTQTLPVRLTRYLSPPLFPVLIRDLPSRIHFHEVPCHNFQIGPFRLDAQYVCHPGPTVGYRISNGEKVVAYLPDHEPALGVHNFPISAEWTSGYELAHDADLLIHDAQFSDEEYSTRIGWGHSTFDQALRFAELARAKHLSLFHHDPDHSDQELQQLFRQYIRLFRNGLKVSLAREGATFQL